MGADIYSKFAYIYDALVEDVNYNAIADYIQKIFRKYSPNRPDLVLELACGTGNLCALLSQRGYDVIGVDASSEMLSVASQKPANRSTLFLQQDMRNFELYGTVDAVVCILDSINYLLTNDDIIRTFSLVRNYLNPGGLFIFDINTKYKFHHVLNGNTFVQQYNNIFYVWQNRLKNDICKLYLDFFVEDKNNMYSRITEIHKQRVYTQSQIKRCIHLAGLELLNIFGELTSMPPRSQDQRIFFVARKPMLLDSKGAHETV